MTTQFLKRTLAILLLLNLSIITYTILTPNKPDVPTLEQPVVSPNVEIPSFAYYLKNPNLQAIKSSSFDFVIIDTENRKGKFTKAEVAEISNQKKVLAYLSIGEAENYRKYWKKEWNRNKPTWIGNENPLWKGNYSISDVTNQTWLNIVKAELDSIIETGYHGVLLNGISSYNEIGTLEARNHMIEFVIALTQYAKSKNKEFFVIVQDSEELLQDEKYLKTIDGILKQYLVYSWKSDGNKGPRNPITEIQKSIDYLKLAKNQNKAVLIVEYVSDDLYQDAKQIIDKEGFIGYSAPRLLDTLRLKQ